MKDDEKIVVLLEGLTSDVSTLLKRLGEQNGKDVSHLSSMVEQLKSIQDSINNKSNEAVPKNDNGFVEAVKELKTQVDKINLRFIREDNFFTYYFSPPRILVVTLMIISLSFFAGAIADSLYAKYKRDKFQPIENER